MARHPDLSRRLQRRLACHQALHDPAREPRNRLAWLPALRRWQAQRLERSFRAFLDDPRRAPAARFFLTDVYGDHDFSRRDADVARVLPMMQRLLPGPLLETVADAIELGALSHAFDLRMAEALDVLAPVAALVPKATRGPLPGKQVLRSARDDGDVVGERNDGGVTGKQDDGHVIDEDLYAAAYRHAGLPRLRAHQIDLIRDVGLGLATALRMPGVGTLLRLSRAPAKAAGLGELQRFLEHGVDAFTRMGDVAAFIDGIERGERAVSARLFAGERDPFGFARGRTGQDSGWKSF